MTIPVAEARISENKDFRPQVLELARLNHWLTYFTWTSIHSVPGFTDLVLVRPPRVIFAELKLRGKELSPNQVVWRDMLKKCPGVEYYTWRPDDFEKIVTILK